jgi:hypothetical protein
MASTVRRSRAGVLAVSGAALTVRVASNPKLTTLAGAPAGDYLNG